MCVYFMDNIQILLRSSEDLKWLNQNYLEVEKNFRNKIVAILNKKIVASGDKLSQVTEKLGKMGLNSNEILIKKIFPKEAVLIF